MSLEVTGRQNCCLPLPQLPLWQGGRERQEQLVALAATHSPLTMVWSTTVSILVGDSKNPQHSLGSPGQARAESRDYLQQFPKCCSHSSCPSWQGGWAPGDGVSWRTRCPSAPSKPPSVTGLPFLLPAAPPAGTGRTPALPCDHPVPNAITFLLLHPTSSSLWERNLPTEHLQQLLGLLQLLHLILPDIQRALGRTVTSPELSHCLGKQHRDKGLWTFPLRKGNS